MKQTEAIDDSEVTIDQQVREGREAVENALDILHTEDPESRESRAAEELNAALMLLGAVGNRVDPRLAALRELFNRDYHEVEKVSGVMGDYTVTIYEGHCIHEDRREPLKALGFEEGSTHVHTDEDDTPYMTLYLNDLRSE